MHTCFLRIPGVSSGVNSRLPVYFVYLANQFDQHWIDQHVRLLYLASNHHFLYPENWVLLIGESFYECNPDDTCLSLDVLTSNESIRNPDGGPAERLMFPTLMNLLRLDFPADFIAGTSSCMVPSSL